MGRRDRRVALAFPGWRWERDEGLEVRELAAGLLEAGAPVVLLDRGVTHEAAVVDGRLALGAPSSRWRLLSAPPAVLVVFLPFPLSQVVVAGLLRLRGTRVVLAPMAFLGEDFAARSWFRGAGRPSSWSKRLAVPALRRIWRLVATVFICASDHEREQAGLPPDRTVLAPLARPRSDLVDALVEEATTDVLPEPARPTGPVALIARFDVHRKGIDRTCRWLDAFADVLPRPAVLLLAPRDSDPPEDIADLCRRGVIEWDQEARGAGLLSPLRRARGVILLTRYEGYPRVLREAVLAGLPVLTTVASNFAETLEAVGSAGRVAGQVVDGDDVAAIQHAFEQLADARVDRHSADRLLDRTEVGKYLWEVVADVADGRRPREPSYYAWAARASSADSGGHSTD